MARKRIIVEYVAENGKWRIAKKVKLNEAGRDVAYTKRNKLKKAGMKTRIRVATLDMWGRVVKREKLEPAGVPAYPNSTHYSKHFTRAELDCPCGCRTPPWQQENLERLARTVLEPLRSRLGMSIPIVSGYRCESYNKKIGGASRSQHMNGKAVDLDMVKLGSRGVTQARVNRELKQLPRVNGIGLYPAGGVHADIRPAPRVTWTSF